MTKNFALLSIATRSDPSNLSDQTKVLIENIKDAKNRLKEIDEVEFSVNTLLNNLPINAYSFNVLFEISKKIIEKLKRNLKDDKLKVIEEFNKSSKKDFDDCSKQINELKKILEELGSIKDNSLASIILNDLKRFYDKLLEIKEKLIIIEKTNAKYDRDFIMKKYNLLSTFEKENSPTFSNQDGKMKINKIVESLENEIKFSRIKIGFVGNSGKF